MISSISINDICKKCGGYKFAPYNSNMSATVKICHCPKSPIDFKLKKFNPKDPSPFPKRYNSDGSECNEM
jgi:hypothetical protein